MAITFLSQVIIEGDFGNAVAAQTTPIAHQNQQTALLVLPWLTDSTEIHWGFREQWKTHLPISSHSGSGAQGESGCSEQGTTGRSGSHLVLFGCCGVHTSPILDSVPPARPILDSVHPRAVKQVFI